MPASLSQTDTGSMRVSGSVLCSQAFEHAEDIFFFLLQAGYLLFKFKDPCGLVLVWLVDLYSKWTDWFHLKRMTTNLKKIL